MTLRRQAALLFVYLSLTIHSPAVFAQDFDVTEASISELQRALDSGEVTSEQLVQQYLDRIQAYDKQGPKLNSIVRINADALLRARALDEERSRRGPRSALHGIPILVKDNYSTTFMPTTNGSVALADFLPPVNATQVDMLLAAGAIVIAKTNLHEYARGITTIASLIGQTRNPYDIRRVPGGSSGGTGAAVAASFGAIGLGSDTCGSIRIPSAFNNLIGLRPTKGLSSIHGVMPLSHTQDVAGPLARSAEDLAILLDIVVGYDPLDEATTLMQTEPAPQFQQSLGEASLPGQRFGRLVGYMERADNATRTAIESALEWYQEQGVVVVDVEIPELSDMISASGLIGLEFKTDFNQYLSEFGSDLDVSRIVSASLYHRALEGGMTRSHEQEVDEEEYAAAFAARDTLKQAIEAVFLEQNLDAIVYPTIGNTPVFTGEPQPGTNCSISANSGLPALSMPVGFSTAGLPVGMELLGEHMTDSELLALAYAYEQAVKPRRPPAVTPPLDRGRVPEPRQSRLVFDGGVGLVANFTMDTVSNLFSYQVELDGASLGRVYAATLMIDRDGNGDANEPVVLTLLGPDTASADGEYFMDPAFREAYAEGSLYLRVFGEDLPGVGAIQRLP